MIVMLTILYLTLRVGSSPLNQSPSLSNFPTAFSCVDNNLQISLEGGIDNLEQLLYHVARSKGVSPATILSRLGRKVKGKQRLDRVRNRNPQDFELPGIRSQENSGPVARQDNIPLEFREEALGISRFLPGMGRTAISEPEVPRRYPFQTAKSPHVMHSIAPAPLFISMQSFKPPPGVTVSVNSDAITTKLSDVTVTLSPMMTVHEALKQADSKFKEVLGIPDSEDDVVAFSYSPFSRCIVVSRFNNVESTDFFAWKLIITDIQGQVIYDNLCLPSEKGVPIKPGTTITLSYTSL